MSAKPRLVSAGLVAALIMSAAFVMFGVLPSQALAEKMQYAGDSVRVVTGPLAGQKELGISPEGPIEDQVDPPTKPATGDKGYEEGSDCAIRTYSSHVYIGAPTSSAPTSSSPSLASIVLTNCR